MKYLVIDFETTGVGKDRQNNYRQYQSELAPLPCANYPVELAVALVEANGEISKEERMLIRGAERLDPWVTCNCPHLSIDECETKGVEFTKALEVLANMAEDATIVSHNVQYDWDEVLVPTVKKLNEEENPFYLALSQCPRFCTCINDKTKKNETAYYYHKLNKWIGPSLEKLSIKNGVHYDSSKAHYATYDVSLTVACLRKGFPELFNITEVCAPDDKDALGTELGLLPLAPPTDNNDKDGKLKALN